MRPITQGAVFSVNREYRYALRRDLAPDGHGTVLFVMLNPSTADADTDDATIRRCKGFARTGRYRTMLVGNLYAYRSRNPKKIERLPDFDRIGVENDLYLERMATQADHSIVAWGARPWALPRMERVLEILGDLCDVYCLGETQDGFPKHPLYLPKTAYPRRYELPERAA